MTLMRFFIATYTQKQNTMPDKQNNLAKALQKHVTEGINELGEKYQAVQILPVLKEMYPTQLLKELVSVRIYQTERFVYLETTIDEHLEKQDVAYDEIMKEIADDMDALKNYRTHRESLSFPVEGESTFNPTDTVLENALLFLSEDHETMAMAYNFFTDEGGDEVRKW